MFIFEFLIYVFFAWTMYSLARESELESLAGNTGSSNGYIWTYLLFFSLISAIRWRVGVDSEAYIKMFMYGAVRDGSTEYLWDILVRGVKDNGLPFYIGTGTAAFIQIFLIYNGTKNYKYLLVWIPVVIFGGRYYLDLMNGVRQMIVMCGFFYLSHYIINKKFIHYIIGILILYLIHNSALLLLPVFLIYYFPIDKINLAEKKYIGLGLLITCFVIGQNPTFQGLGKGIEAIVTISGYGDTYSSFFNQVIMGKRSESLSFGPIMFSFLLSAILIIWFAPEMKYYYERKIPYFNLWYFFSLFYACGYFLVCNLSHMMIRPFQYFEIFQIILLAMLLNFLYESEKARYILYGVIIVIWTCTLVGVYKSTGQSIEFTTYKVFFNNI